MACEPNELEGVAYPPGSSRSIPAVIAVDEASVRLVAEGAPRLAYDKAVLMLSGRVASIPRKVTFPGGWMFETGDNDGVDRLLPPKRSARAVNRLEEFHPRLIALAVFAVLAMIGVYRYLLPLMIELAVAVTPEAVNVALSQATIRSLDQTVLSESALDEDEQADLLEQFNAIAAQSTRGVDGYKLHFRDGGRIGPNAFALPDGTLVITDQLIAMAGRNDDAIMGVLAHEIGHVEHDHSLRQLYRVAGISGLAMIIAGDLGSAAEDLLLQGSALLSLSYSREYEADADSYSVKLMRQAGRDPAALADFFELLRKEHGNMDYGILATHPANDERIAAVRRQAGE